MFKKERKNGGEEKCERRTREIGLRQLLTREFTYLSSAGRSFFVCGFAEIFVRSVSSK